MKLAVFAALLLASTLAAGSANAQYAPFNEAGVTMGHWHLASKDAEANKKIFLGMGGKLLPGAAPSVQFPVRITKINPEVSESGSHARIDRGRPLQDRVLAPFGSGFVS